MRGWGGEGPAATLWLRVSTVLVHQQVLSWFHLRKLTDLPFPQPHTPSLPLEQASGPQRPVTVDAACEEAYNAAGV
jgi:hypothetical protein